MKVDDVKMKDNNVKMFVDDVKKIANLLIYMVRLSVGRTTNKKYRLAM